METIVMKFSISRDRFDLLFKSSDDIIGLGDLNSDFREPNHNTVTELDKSQLLAKITMNDRSKQHKTIYST